MATLQEQLDAINAEIASGQLSLRHGETSKTSRPLSELLQIRADIERRIAGSSGTGNGRVSRTAATFSRGF